MTMASTDSRVEIKLPGRPEFISVARLAVAAVATRMGFNYDDIEDLKVATSEALTNAIEDAQSRGADEPVSVTCIIGPQALVIEVRDQGSGFDPASRRTAGDGELQEGGLGLALIEALCDGVEFRTEAGCGTLVRMTKRLAES